MDIWQIIISVKTSFDKIKKDALSNLILHGSRNVNSENKCSLLRNWAKFVKFQGNRSPWLKVVDVDNGRHLFTRRVIILHCSILPFYPSDLGSGFVLLKGIENTSKMLQIFIFQ